VVFIEPDGAIAWANDAALAMHGCKTLAELGSSVSEYHDRFLLRLRDGVALQAKNLPMARLMRGETFEDLVVEVCRRDRPELDWIHRERGLVLGGDENSPAAASC
jgi:hypothetical protein